MKFKKRAIAGTVAGFVLAGGAAFAAVTIFGGGDVAAAATVPSALTVDKDVEFVSPLLPGGSADIKGVVRNPNSFPVKVTSVIVKDGATGSGKDCDLSSLTIGGKHDTYTIDSSGTKASGYQIFLPTPVDISAGGGAYVTAPNAVSQKSGATAFCGFAASIAVTATAGN